MRMYYRKSHGFTLIELLVVVAIIGLLASVVVSSLGEARRSSRDAIRKSDLRAIKFALELYHAEYGTYQVANTGWRGGGNGWVSQISPPNYSQSVTQELVDQGFLSRSSEDPLQSPGYMMYLCAGGQSYSLSATLEKPTATDIAHVVTVCNGAGGNSIYTRYGKNYAVSGD